MIIHSSSLFAAPLALIMWVVDIFVFLACVRLLLARVSGEWASRVVEGLTPITDQIPQALGRYLSTHRRRVAPAWALWLCVLGSAIVLRYALLAIVVTCL